MHIMQFMFRRFSAAVFALLLPVGAWADDIQGLVMPLKSVSVSSPVLQEIVDAVLVEEGDLAAFVNAVRQP